MYPVLIGANVLAGFAPDCDVSPVSYSFVTGEPPFVFIEVFSVFDCLGFPVVVFEPLFMLLSTFVVCREHCVRVL